MAAGGGGGDGGGGDGGDSGGGPDFGGGDPSSQGVGTAGDYAGFSGFDVGGGTFGGEPGTTGASSAAAQGIGGGTATGGVAGSTGDFFGGLFGGTPGISTSDMAAQAAGIYGGRGVADPNAAMAAMMGMATEDIFGIGPAVQSALQGILGSSFLGPIASALSGHADPIDMALSMMGIGGVPGASIAGSISGITGAGRSIDQALGIGTPGAAPTGGGATGPGPGVGGNVGGGIGGADFGGPGGGGAGGENLAVSSVTTPQQAAERLVSLGVANPSVAALSQALRTVPDLGYSPGGTVFGGDSTGEPKKIWNKASLRVTDSSPSDQGAALT